MNKPRGLHGWIRLLEGNQAASLAGLLRELDRVTASDETSGQQLCDIILKDASLTSHIIRIGNSIQFNPSTIPVTTVSRAVINIGFKHIRSVCLTVKVLESLIGDDGSDLLYARLATCLHSAHQSRMLCEKFNASEREEAFVASLLSNLTELLVLSSNRPEAKELSQRLEIHSTAKERNAVAEEVLGVSFKRLSKTLIKRWRIDGLVNQIYDPGSVDKRLNAIALGEDIALAALKGWNSASFKTALKRSVSHLGKPGNEVKIGIQNAADATASALEAFGNDRLNSLVPSRSQEILPVRKTDSSSENTSQSRSSSDENSSAGESASVDAGEGQETTAKDKTNQKPNGSSDAGNNGAQGGADVSESEREDLLQPDPQAQLKSLQQISEMMLGTLQINAFMQTLLKGLNKGVGLERCAFLLFERGHRRLITKYAIGDGVDTWPGKLHMAVSDPVNGFLAKLFKNDQVANVAKNEECSAVEKSELNAIRMNVDNDAFLLAPLTANGKKVGLLYADMATSGREIDGQYVIGFQQFFLQSKIALGMIANQQKK